MLCRFFIVLFCWLAFTVAGRAADYLEVPKFPPTKMMEDLPPIIPCHTIKASAERSFPRSRVAASGGCSYGRCTSAEYFNLKFKTLENQNYQPHEKIYMFPAAYQVGDGEGGYREFDYGGGSTSTHAHTGWIYYRVEKISETYKPSIHDTVPHRRVRHETVGDPYSGYHSYFADDGSAAGLPSNAPVRINWGNGNVKMVYELCYLASRTYPVRTTLNAKKTYVIYGFSQDSDANKFANGMPSVGYSFAETPTYFGYLVTAETDFKELDRALGFAETGLTILRDVTPIVGTICSAVPCTKKPSWECWAGVGLDAAADAATLVGVGLGAKAAKLAKLKNLEAVNDVQKAEKMLRRVNYAIAAGNAGLAFQYYQNGEIGQALGRGIAAGADIGIIEFALAGVKKLGNLRYVETKVKTGGAYCKKCPEVATVADEVGETAAVRAFPTEPRDVEILPDAVLLAELNEALRTGARILTAAEKEAVIKAVDKLSDAYARAAAKSVDTASFVDEVNDILVESLGVPANKANYSSITEALFPQSEQIRIAQLAESITDPIERLDTINRQLKPFLHAMDFKYVPSTDTLVMKHLKFETPAGNRADYLNCCEDSESVVQDILAVHTKVVALEEALHAAQRAGIPGDRDIALTFTKEFDEMLEWLKKSDDEGGAMKVFFTDMLGNNTLRDAKLGQLAQGYELEPHILLEKYFAHDGSAEVASVVREYSRRYMARYYTAVKAWSEGKAFGGLSGQALEDWLKKTTPDFGVNARLAGSPESIPVDPSIPPMLVDETMDEIFTRAPNALAKSPRGTIGYANRVKPSKPAGSLPEGMSHRRAPDSNDPRPIEGENEAADLLADKGFEVEHLPEGPSNTFGVRPESNPDFLVEGKAFDAFTPKPTTSVRNIWSTIKGKTETQAERVIINLDDWTGSIDALKTQFNDWEIPTLKEVMFMKDGNIEQLFPF